jgi:molybdenum cofactor cytidylyltransferase
MKQLPTVIVLADPTLEDGPSPAEDARPHAALEATLRQVLASGLPMLLVAPCELADWARQILPGNDVLTAPEASAKSGPWLTQAIRLGVQSSAHATGWLLLPGDLPCMQARTLLTLASSLMSFPVVYPQYGQQQGQPMGFSGELYSELVGLGHQRDLIRLAARYPATAVDIDDPDLLRPLARHPGIVAWRRRAAMVSALG